MLRRAIYCRTRQKRAQFRRSRVSRAEIRKLLGHPFRGALR
jgi:hypothetical protein